jgi:2-polyprenyl-3-methyl-5-hydroxy-6-metoxy-1,4-benzoquinol methylase
MNLITGEGFLCYSAYFAIMQPQGSFKKYIPSFAAKLSDINPDVLPMSDYCKRYLYHLLTHRFYYLAIYTHVLDNIIDPFGKTAGQLNLVDYGAGNGLLGMFAKYCGFKKVFICDVDADFVQASQIVSRQLQISIDGFINGDIDKLQDAVKGQTIDVMAGTDVIEHIYNLDDFFASVQAINKKMVTVFTTASNPDNFIKTRQLKKLQLKDELQGSNPEDFLLAGAEKHEAFIVMREKIIAQYFPGLTKADLMQLSSQTRGLKKEDILTAVQHFLNTGELPVAEGNFNTCNPLTGSWTERILSIKEYKNIYTEHGFSLILKNGFYNSYSPGFKKYLNRALNFLVKLTGKNAAAFITLVGYKPG